MSPSMAPDGTTKTFAAHPHPLVVTPWSGVLMHVWSRTPQVTREYSQFGCGISPPTGKGEITFPRRPIMDEWGVASRMILRFIV